MVTGYVTENVTDNDKKLPVLYAADIAECQREDLWGERKRHGNGIVPGEGWVIGFTGIRGSGKSLSLAFMIAFCLIQGLTVWSNMRVAFRCCFGPGEWKDLETTPIDWKAVYSLEEGISHGVIAIDELVYYMDSRSSMGMRNRLVNAVINQVRKRSLDFYFTVKDMSWLDKRLRVWETDVEIACWDLHRTQGNIPKGHHIRWQCYDQSGAWTGRQWVPGMPPTTQKNLQYADKIWPIYDTSEIINFIEAQQRIQVEAGTMVIGAGANERIVFRENLQRLIGDLKTENYAEIESEDLKRLLPEYGLPPNLHKLGQTLSDMGIRCRRARGKYSSSVYEL